jgi:hypothetical protein
LYPQKVNGIQKKTRQQYLEYIRIPEIMVKLRCTVNLLHFLLTLKPKGYFHKNQNIDIFLKTILCHLPGGICFSH